MKSTMFRPSQPQVGGGEPRPRGRLAERWQRRLAHGGLGGTGLRVRPGDSHGEATDYPLVNIQKAIENGHL